MFYQTSTRLVPFRPMHQSNDLTTSRIWRAGAKKENDEKTTTDGHMCCLSQGSVQTRNSARSHASRLTPFHPQRCLFTVISLS